MYLLISSGRTSLTSNCCLLVGSKCQGPALQPVCAYFGGKTSRSYICWHKEEENVNISQCQMSVLMNAVTKSRIVSYIKTSPPCSKTRLIITAQQARLSLNSTYLISTLSPRVRFLSSDVWVVAMDQMHSLCRDGEANIITYTEFLILDWAIKQVVKLFLLPLCKRLFMFSLS